MKRRITFPDERRQFERTQRNVDLLHCPTCFASRPVDANAIFCRSCGGALPPLPAPVSMPPRADRLTVCNACGSTCSLDANVCLVCEAPVGSTLLTDRRPSEMERRLCPTCGSLNPVQMTSCLTCEAALPQGMSSLINISSLLPGHQVRPTSGLSMWSEPTPLSMNTRPVAALSECRVCHRQNSADARFCDRCGTKDPCVVSYQQSVAPPVNFTACNTNLNSSATLQPQKTYFDPAMEANHLLHSQATMNSLLEPQRLSQPVLGADNLMCTKCFSVNTIDSRFCVRCGTAFGPTLPSKASIFALSSVPNALLGSGPPEPRKRTLSSIGTQTTGIYYPSAGDLRRALSDVQLLNNLKKDIRTRARLLAPISPGRGYWRMQLEHILVHLKAHTQNNADFRHLLGNPRLGKLLYAGIEEDEGELTIFMTFQHHNPRLTTQDLLPMPLDAKADRINRNGGVPQAAARSKAHQCNNNNCFSPPSDNVHFEDDSWASRSFDNLTITDDLAEDGAAVPLRSTSTAHGLESSKMCGKRSRQQKRVGRRKAKIQPVPQQQSKDTGNFAGKNNNNNNGGSNDTFQSAQPLLSKSRADPNASLLPGLAAIVEQRVANLSAVDSALLLHLRSGPSETDKEVSDLLAKGANPRCVDPSGDAALVVAVRNRCLSAIPALVHAGADVNTVGNRNGNSVLHEAVLLGDEAVQIVQALLELGADPTGNNAQGRSAQDIADELGFTKISNLLAAEVDRKKQQEGADRIWTVPAYAFEGPTQ
uniref:RanBP2-type domain-containing protein n=1 Tax=Schistocephalus solidus TaxID=70667 RepID=A0A0X3NJG8_SCHSO